MHPTNGPHAPNLPIRFAAAALGLAALALAAVGLYAAFVPLGVRLWNTAIFSAIMAISAGFTLPIAAGHFARGRGIALLSGAGAIGAGALFAYIEARANTSSNPDWARLLRFWFLGSLATSAGLTLLAAVDVLLRRPGPSLRRLGIGLGLVVPLALLAGLAYVAFPGWPSGARAAFVVLGGAVMIALASASGHFLIRAFEAATEQPTPSAPPPKPAPAPQPPPAS